MDAVDARLEGDTGSQSIQRSHSVPGEFGAASGSSTSGVFMLMRAKCLTDEVSLGWSTEGDQILGMGRRQLFTTEYSWVMMDDG